MNKILLGSWLLTFLFCLSAVAQDGTISGRVTSSDDGSGLPGVTVQVRGANRGTTTDANGNYRLTATSANTLVFSFIGYVTQEAAVDNRSVINVSLVGDSQQLSEVVVIGYGTQQRQRVTSSISEVKGDAIANLATPSFDQQLAGRAAGVQVSTPSGILGQAPVIRIRGINSISSGASPLIVVDGVPLITGNQSGTTPTNPLGDINPQDIESYDVLKDGAATAIYGSRAANGVILITTKKGRKNSGVRVNLDVQGGVTNPITRFDLLNAQEFVQISNEKSANAGGQTIAALDANNTNTDWQNQIFRQGTSSNYNLSIAGGGERTNYYTSVGFNKQVGAIRPNDQTRFSFLSNIDHSFNKFLSVGAKVQVARTINNGLNTGTNALSGNITAAARLLPNVPVYDASNPTGYNISPDGAILGSGANSRNIDNNYTNIRFVIDNNKLGATTTRILPTAFVNITPFSGLSLRSQVGADYTDVRTLLSYDPRHGDGRGSNGIVSQTSREVIRWNVQNVLNFDRDFGGHNIGLTLGTEYQKTTTSSFTAGGQNFSDRFFLQNGLITGNYATQLSSGTFVPSGFDSYFGRLQYSYRDKYLASFSARNDGLSSLPLANRRGTFIGGSLGYRIAQEDFYKNSSLARVMNDLKIRASYAEVGNTEIGSFPYVGTFSAAQYGSQNGIGFGQAGNLDLRWERSKKIDIGLDLGFLSNRITASFDFFRNNIDGLILAAPTPSSLGIPNNSINRNVGAMYNQGFEAAVTVDAINKGGFRWNVSANFTTLNNKIEALNKNNEGVDQDIIYTYNINRVGYAVGSIYGYEYAGVNSSNGNPMYYKADGSIVQRILSSGNYAVYDPNSPSSVAQSATLNATTDRKILGNTNPTYYGGVTNSFSYGGFDLQVFVRYSGGNKIMNVTRQETLLNQDFNNNGREILNRWQREGDVTDVPRLYLSRTAQANQTGNAISRFVEKGDFVRIQNIVVGYTLPKGLLGRGAFPINSLRVYAQVQNAFTFTKYKGLDPEINANVGVDNENSQFGVDYNTNPQLRVITFGLSLGL
ncbi:SusC/RagA family TonB-linked outer membrane protein [Spirosoma rhododendri]|uniref:TonB-dependent receptor n=1 Tax=Spirosoma rhododendri TaxID=2728024 RepID=A0A7L5DKD4_9BACT|nr:TonB-dependent receptor [Spirosoma rhododendri]QJD78934.1 TonB-dependent receptor [Spirosoma rhododendri]